MIPEDLALLGIDSASILYVWSWGFGSVIFFHFLGYCVGAAKRMVELL